VRVLGLDGLGRVPGVVRLGRAGPPSDGECRLSGRGGADDPVRVVPGVVLEQLGRVDGTHRGVRRRHEDAVARLDQRVPWVAGANGGVGRAVPGFVLLVVVGVGRRLRVLRHRDQVEDTWLEQLVQGRAESSGERGSGLPGLVLLVVVGVGRHLRLLWRRGQEPHTRLEQLVQGRHAKPSDGCQPGLPK